MIHYDVFDQIYYNPELCADWYVMVDDGTGYNGITHNPVFARKFVNTGHVCYRINCVNWFKLEKLCKRRAILHDISMYDMLVAYENSLLSELFIGPCRMFTVPQFDTHDMRTKCINKIQRGYMILQSPYVSYDCELWTYDNIWEYMMMGLCYDDDYLAVINHRNIMEEQGVIYL